MEKQPSRKALMEQIAALKTELRKTLQDLNRELARRSTSVGDAESQRCPLSCAF